jgi:hypothetical protein
MLLFVYFVCSVVSRLCDRTRLMLYFFATLGGNGTSGAPRSCSRPK